MKVLLIGYGHINKLIESNDHIQVVGIVTRSVEEIKEDPDIIIDFSHHSFLYKTIYYALNYKIPVIIGTTGYKKEELNEIIKLSETVPVLTSENFSLGIFLVKNMLEKNIHIVNKFRKNIYETHHSLKQDIPSGTALKINEILNANSIISYRVENVLGKHKIVLSDDYERIEIIHEVLDRRLFTKNVLLAAQKLKEHKMGLFKFEDIVNDKL